MDPEPVRGTLGMRWEYTPDGTPVHCRHDTHTHSHLWAVEHQQSTNWHVFGRWEESRKPRENPCGDVCLAMEKNF